MAYIEDGAGMTTLLIVSAVVAVAFVFGGWFIWFSPWAHTQRASHEARWAGFVDVRPDGLTELQRECERRLAEELASRGLSLRNRRIESDVGPNRDESMIIAEVPELDARVWLYPDQTDIVTPQKKLRLEEWDTLTPEEHFETVVSFVSSVQVVKSTSVGG